VNLTVPIRFSPKPKTERPALAEPLTDSDKKAAYDVLKKDCIGIVTRDSPKVPRYYSRGPFTEQEISSYCECTASMMADSITQEEYALRYTKLPASLIEKAKCVAVEMCKKHLNLPDPSQFQYEECWKG
jgi:hypothetical protein